ncbi:hypothetical protein O6H91_08G058700 [Diphasiastrum complanatum]|uniref:Uncharacterized protein n=1 Tax=Diphasiastrum complanatum TaxID=34168 RepID=A0ACC2CXZ0_DIPCM|nr:hypothetical protein O6H91_08G058700 [Diphasiastrum complanatum]
MMDFRTGASHANDKRLELGLVFPDCIEWRRWTPGMEYNKMLYIKNVTRKVMIVHWVPPPTCFFNLNFEDPVRLNPGATAALQVVFKPVKSQLYESKIEFFTLKGNFSINLKGSIPRVQLEVPASLDFGVCFVNDICERKFEVMNSGEEPITLKWNVDSPFLLFPAMATLGSGHSATIMGRFEPVQPGAYAAMAFCEPDLSSILQIRLNGIAKYSCLTISQYSLKFEDVMVKSSKRMDLQVHNISEVAVHFWIESAGKPLHHMESVFLAQPSKGTVVANGSITLEVRITFLRKSLVSFSHKDDNVYGCSLLMKYIVCLRHFSNLFLL